MRASEDGAAKEERTICLPVYARRKARDSKRLAIYSYFINPSRRAIVYYNLYTLRRTSHLCCIEPIFLFSRGISRNYPSKPRRGTRCRGSGVNKSRARIIATNVICSRPSIRPEESYAIIISRPPLPRLILRFSASAIEQTRKTKKGMLMPPRDGAAPRCSPPRI